MRGSAGWPEARGEPVGVQAGADHDRVGLHAHPVRELRPRPRARLVDDAGDLGAEPDLAAGRRDLGRERAGHRGEVDDRRARRVQRGDPGRVRLELAQARRRRPSRRPGTPLATARSWIRSSRPSSASSVATTTLPHSS